MPWDCIVFIHLNVGKTKEMIIDFHRNKNCIDPQPLLINDETIEQVDIGVTVDSKLQWDLRIGNLATKLNKRMYFVRKLH